MCGRFVGFRPLKALQAYFPIDVSSVAATQNFNVAPSQEVLAIVRRNHQNHLERLHWGLVPFWAKDTAIGRRLINARSETAAVKPSFRDAFKKRRCLIVADGFYEWQRQQGRQQPMFLTLPEEEPFAFAGLWERWDDKGRLSRPYRSCTILTRSASPSVRPVHHRMPVILKPEAYHAWLDPSNQQVEALLHIIENRILTELVGVPVSRQVNRVENNRPDNILPLSAD